MPFTESKVLGPKPWGEELLLVETPLYTLKRLTYRAGHQGGFQLHERKDEAFTLHSGGAEVTWVEDGQVRSRCMQPGDTFHVPPGMPHKVRAITTCVMYEASNPVFNDRVNVADVYGDEDGVAR